MAKHPSYRTCNRNSPFTTSATVERPGERGPEGVTVSGERGRERGGYGLTFFLLAKTGGGA
jgi:hypothetical protein